MGEKTLLSQGAKAEREAQFWADTIARTAAEPEGGVHVVSDAKTPSGRIHVGSLRGVLIHDVIYKALADAGKKAEFVYRFDDFDPMDSFPEYLPESFRQYLGKPLCSIPSPEPGFDSFAQYYAADFQAVFEALDCRPRLAWGSRDYKSGRMDDFIRIALENAASVRDINVRISGAKKQGEWLPLHVVCDKCGRIGTTQAKNFDGSTVEYACSGATYSAGCGHSGRKSPFGGESKLTWKVQWAAQWKLYGVTEEGEGKDHAVVGGSRSVADAVSKEIYSYKPPYDLSYEFFLVGGKKMSSSKGLGSSASDVLSTLPPELLRFLMVRYKPRTAINFSPEGETLPRLYDDYDAFGESYFGRRESRDPDEPRIFELSQVNGKEPRDFYRPQFSLVAYLMQVPHVNVKAAVAKQKGAPLSQEEEGELARRLHVAQNWLAKYASEEYKLSVLDAATGVKAFHELSAPLQRALHEFGEFFAENSNENAHASMIKALCDKYNLKQAEFYEGAYRIFLGKPKGPKLLPFLNALEKTFVCQRLKGVV